MRERGLKSEGSRTARAVKGRSREGAWIEISRMLNSNASQKSRSREGAWIEIPSLLKKSLAGVKVAPVRERGLKCSDVSR